MYTSLYILLSVLHYWLDAYPSHQSLKEQTGYRKAAMQSAWPEPWLKRFGKVRRVCFYVETANQFVCCLLLLLKIMGVIRWW